ncbi:MAG: hypothetical protein KAS47_08200 [Candidatus Heimdallarchaeota archaeon]|nr:hypothetical protein [Candidatus Heimdallarchaeota archaeon]
MSIINFTSEIEHIIFSKDISTDIKNTSNLFTYIIHKLKDKYPDIRLQENTTIVFNTKIQQRKFLVEIQDSVKGNFLKLDFTSKNSRFKQFFNSLSNKRLFGVRMGSVTILVALLSVLSVLITIFWQNALALLIVGISSVVLAVLAVIFYNPLTKMFSYTQSKRHNAILEIANRIEKLIYDYPNHETSLKKCWNCFKEVRLEQDICENCKKSLVDRH